MRMGNSKENTYACYSLRERLQGMRFTNNGNSIIKTQK